MLCELTILQQGPPAVGIQVGRGSVHVLFFKRIPNLGWHPSRRLSAPLRSTQRAGLSVAGKRKQAALSPWQCVSRRRALPICRRSLSGANGPGRTHMISASSRSIVSVQAVRALYRILQPESLPTKTETMRQHKPQLLCKSLSGTWPRLMIPA